jgi:hypothetical protein
MPEIRREDQSYYFSYFKKLYESWEKSMSEAMDLWLNNPVFTDSAEKAIEKSVEFKDYTYDIMERTLKNRYIFTAYDMDKLTRSLDNIETKLNKLEEKINEIQSAKRSSTESKKGSLKKGGKKQ